MNPHGNSRNDGNRIPAGKWTPLAMGAAILTGTVALLLLADANREVAGEARLEIIPGELIANLPGRQLVTKVQIRNRSKRHVSLGDFRSSCGCTIVDSVQRDQLGPGEITELGVTLTVPKYGTREATIQFSSDGREYSIPVTLQGERDPVPRLIGFPRDIALRGRSQDSIESRTFTFDAIEPFGSEPWVEAVESTDSQLRAVVSPADEVPYGNRGTLVRRSYRVMLKGEIDDPRKSVLRAEIVPKVRVVDEESVSDRCLVTLEVVPLIAPAPRQLVFLKTRDRSRPAEKSVLLAVNGSETVTFDVASIDRKWLEAKIVDSASQQLKMLVVSPSAACDDRLPVESEIVLTCSVDGSSHTERVVIPVMIAGSGDSD